MTGDGRTSDDPLVQARTQLERLSSQIEAVIWSKDHMELRFPEDFDATYIVTTDGDRIYCRRGPRECRETFLHLEQLVCRLYDAEGRQIRYPGQGNFPMLKQWMQLYLSLGQGRPEGMNWMRFHIEPATVRFELEGLPVKNSEGSYIKFVISSDRPR